MEHTSTVNHSGGQFNDLHSYEAFQVEHFSNRISGMYFPEIYKKRRTEKGQTSTTSSTSSSVTTATAKDVVQLVRERLQNRTNASLLESKANCWIPPPPQLQMNRTPTTEAEGVRVAMDREQPFQCILALGHKERFTKKRSKGPTRVRDLASLMGIAERKLLPTLPAKQAVLKAQGAEVSHGPQNCTEALVAESHAFARRKRKMSRSQGAFALKRKQPESKALSLVLTEHERVLYDLIQSKKDMGIWTRDMKRESNLPDPVVNKSLKVLQGKRLIKEVVNIQNKGRKHFMAVEFEPSKELTGGDWYVNGNLDMDLIQVLRDVCLKHFFKMKVSTVERIVDAIKRTRAFKLDLTTQQVAEIVDALVLDGEIIKVTSTGFGDFTSIPIGADCYKCTRREGPNVGAMASFPCGVCRQINLCTPDGIISPRTCVYYAKWLDF